MKKNNESKCLLSVIVPNIGINEHLEKTIDSILSQTYKEIELILVGDKYFENIKKKYDDKSIKFVSSNCKDVVFNMIEGVKVANGKYVNFLMPYNYVSIDLYRIMINKAIKSNSDMVMSNYVEEASNGERYIYNLICEPMNEIVDKNCLNLFLKQEGLNNQWNLIDNKIFSKKVCDNALDELSNKKILGRDYLLFLYFLIKNTNKVNKIDNDVLFNRGYLNNSNINIESIIDTFEYIEKDLQSSNILEKYALNIQHWKDLYYQKNKNTEKSILKKFNSNYKEVKDEDYYYSVKTPWNDGLEKIKKGILDEKIKCVSFDIFDTLVVRPFLNPTDLFIVMDKKFREWTNNKTAMEFNLMRVDSEKLARQNKLRDDSNAQDIFLDEIYDTMKKRYRIDEALIDRLKKLEIEQELRFCEKRQTGYDLYSLAVYLGKKVICTSDMYLPKDIIERILQKNEYKDLNFVYVSCEYNKTKASGDLYDFVLKDNDLKGLQMVHIGDNYVSDYEHAKAKKINAYCLPKAVEIFLDDKVTNALSAMLYHNLPFWIDTANSMNFTGIRTMIAVVANKYFDNPFKSFNRLSDFNSDPYLIGYYALGMYMFGLNKWMLDDFKNENYEKIVFMARDGYLPIQCYKLMKKYYKNAPKEEYLYISRKALIPIIIQDKMDFYKLPETLNVEKNTPRDIINYVQYLVDYDEEKFVNICNDNKIYVDKKIKSLEEFYRFIDLVLDNFYDKNKHEKNLKILKCYFEEKFGTHSATFDVGYSARPSYFISNLLNSSIDTYFCNINHSLSVRHAEMGKFKLKTFFDGKPSTTGHAYEMFISTLDASCINYDIVNDKVVERFDKYESISTVEFAINTMQNAAIDFVSDIVNIFGSDIDLLTFQNYYVSLPFLAYMNSAREIDRFPFSSTLFEDNLALGDPLKMVKIWKDELIAKNQYTISALMSMDSDVETFNISKRLNYNSNVDLNKKSKFLRLLFYILFDRETLRRRFDELTYKVRHRK